MFGISAAARTLDEMIAKHAQEAACQITEVYAWRSQKDRASEWLDRALMQRDGGLAEVKVDILLAGLRGGPRYMALLREMHLPE